MDYAESQRNPGKHMAGFVVVVLLHVILGYALVNGLARKIVEVIKAPIETKIIDEVKPPPPPPPENLPPPPKFAPPPPSYAPPPEVQIANPIAAPAISVQSVAPPAAPVTLAPAPAPTAAPAPAAPAPVRQAVAAKIDVSTCEKPEYPSAAARAEATGTTKIRFVVDASGVVSKADVERSAGASREHRLLDRTAVDALSKCRFKPGTDEHGKPIGGTTVVDYVWKLD